MAEKSRMAIEKDDVEGRLVGALKRIRRRDRQLLDYDAAERTICAKLAEYLAEVFPAHDVDVEYNRHGTEAKRLKNVSGCSEISDPLVYPDVIVHQRGHDKNNLLVIELKKSTNGASRDCDFAKLHGFVDQFGYTFAVLVDLPTGSAAGAQAELTWI